MKETSKTHITYHCKVSLKKEMQIHACPSKAFKLFTTFVEGFVDICVLLGHIHGFALLSSKVLYNDDVKVM